MNRISTVALACFTLAALGAAAGPFDQFKGKMREGMYEYKMDMDMGAVPGMPPGMGKQSMTFQKCLTSKEIEDGGFGKGDRARNKPESCDVKDMNVSGNTATYKMVCTQPKMTADNKITFSSTGFNMDMKMAMDHNGQMMNMNQHMESRYLGPCK